VTPPWRGAGVPGAAAWHAEPVPGHILIVEDDPSVREAAAFVLERAGFEVTGVADGGEGLDALAEPGRFDLVLLDLMLPSRSGFDVCREIRRTSGVPIVMLTARAEITDVVAGLELGADDYITKPFVPAELSARIRAVLRRSSADDGGSAPGELRARDVVVDEGAFRAFRAGEEVQLTTIEFRLLAELVRNAGRVLTREVLLERVWGYDYLGDSRLVDMAVKRLRGKLGPAPGPEDYVATVRGVGYRFERG
jgi:two-component system, OmpR family, response regulator MtrA